MLPTLAGSWPPMDLSIRLALPSCRRLSTSNGVTRLPTAAVSEREDGPAPKGALTGSKLALGCCTARRLLAGAWRGASSEACAAPGAVLVWAAVRWAEECGGAAPLCWPGGSVCSLHDVRLTWLRMMRLVRSRLIQAGLDRASIVKPASPSGPCSSRPCSRCARSCAQVAMMRQGSRSGTIPWMPHSGHAQAPDLSLCCETLLAFTCLKRPRQRRARGRRTEHERQTPLIRPRHALTGPGSARAHRLTQHHSSHLGMVPLLQAPDLHQALLRATQVLLVAAGWGLFVMPLRPTAFRAPPTHACRSGAAGNAACILAGG